MTSDKTPRGDLAIRTIAMPADTNPNGDIFGGWVVSQMDLAGVSIGSRYTQHRLVTVAIDKMVFIAPVKVGDAVCVYGELVKIGYKSITIHIDTWACGRNDRERRRVTEGVFTFVAIDDDGKAVPVEG